MNCALCIGYKGVVYFMHSHVWYIYYKSLFDSILSKFQRLALFVSICRKTYHLCHCFLIRWKFAWSILDVFSSFLTMLSMFGCWRTMALSGFWGSVSQECLIFLTSLIAISFIYLCCLLNQNCFSNAWCRRSINKWWKGVPSYELLVTYTGWSYQGLKEVRGVYMSRTLSMRVVAFVNLPEATQDSDSFWVAKFSVES